jgi:hypothetical protein
MSMEFSPEYVRRLQRRDQQAFSELYTKMVDRLYRCMIWSAIFLSNSEIVSIVSTLHNP